jgi:hypothetical protein
MNRDMLVVQQQRRKRQVAVNNRVSTPNFRRINKHYGGLDQDNENRATTPFHLRAQKKHTT